MDLLEASAHEQHPTPERRPDASQVEAEAA
jgi:hypothetical protein